MTLLQVFKVVLFWFSFAKKSTAGRYVPPFHEVDDTIGHQAFMYEHWVIDNLSLCHVSVINSKVSAKPYRRSFVVLLTVLLTALHAALHATLLFYSSYKGALNG